MKTNKIIIYDFDNTEVVLDIPEKEIEEICVFIISGDETGTITFVDGTQISFDASDCRIMSFDDGYYEVTGSNIDKWVNWKPPIDVGCCAYDRYDVFR